MHSEAWGGITHLCLCCECQRHTSQGLERSRVGGGEGREGGGGEGGGGGGGGE